MLHYRYIIGILLALLVGTLTVQWSQIKELAGLLSFGLSLASLVLAVIAIFQAIFSSSSLSQVTSAVLAASSQVERATADIEKVSIAIEQQIDGVPTALADMSSRFGAVEARLMNEPAPSNNPPNEASVSQEERTEPMTFGVVVALLLCCYGVASKKPFELEKALPDTSGPKTRSYVRGCIATLIAMDHVDGWFVGDNYRIFDVKGYDIVHLEALLLSFPGPMNEKALSHFKSFFQPAS